MVGEGHALPATMDYGGMPDGVNMLLDLKMMAGAGAVRMDTTWWRDWDSTLMILNASRLSDIFVVQFRHEKSWYSRTQSANC